MPIETPLKRPPRRFPCRHADGRAARPARDSTPTPAFPFQLVAQEQFVETNNLVRVFAYISQGTTALPGYTLHVSKDGVDLPAGGSWRIRRGLRGRSPTRANVSKI